MPAAVQPNGSGLPGGLCFHDEVNVGILYKRAASKFSPFIKGSQRGFKRSALI